MERSDVASRFYLLFLLVSLACISSSCDSPQTQSADGIDDFISVAQQSLKKLEKGNIKRNSGFYIECAVDIRRDKGIRISETVCDKDSTRSITIRITDPTSRPPSQKLRSINLASLSGEMITAKKGESKTIENGLTIKLDRSGQSIIMDWNIETP